MRNMVYDLRSRRESFCFAFYLEAAAGAAAAEAAGAAAGAALPLSAAAICAAVSCVLNPSGFSVCQRSISTTACSMLNVHLNLSTCAALVGSA